MELSVHPTDNLIFNSERQEQVSSQYPQNKQSNKPTYQCISLKKCIFLSPKHKAVMHSEPHQRESHRSNLALSHMISSFRHFDTHQRQNTRYRADPYPGTPPPAYKKQQNNRMDKQRGRSQAVMWVWSIFWNTQVWFHHCVIKQPHHWPKNVEYMPHFQGECLIHYYNLVDIFICAIWNSKESEIMRKSRGTTHLITITRIMFPPGNLATCLLTGCCALSSGLSLNQKKKSFSSFFYKLSYPVASVIGFYCLC